MVSELQMLAGIGVVFVSTVVAWQLWRTRDNSRFSKGETEAWYEQTRRLCNEGLEHIDRFQSDAESVDHDELREGMAELVTHLSRHAGDAVDVQADDEVVRALQEASLACQELSEAQITIGGTSEWDDALERATDCLEYAKTQSAQRV